MAGWMYRKARGRVGSDPSGEFVPININQTIVKGDIVVISAGMGSKAANAPGSGTIMGIACSGLVVGGTRDADDRIQVIYAGGVEWEVPVWQGGTKKTFAATDIGSAFDIKADTHSIDPDTTSASMILVGYDNTNKTARVVIKESAIALGLTG